MPSRDDPALRAGYDRAVKEADRVKAFWLELKLKTRWSFQRCGSTKYYVHLGSQWSSREGLELIFKPY